MTAPHSPLVEKVISAIDDAIDRTCMGEYTVSYESNHPATRAAIGQAALDACHAEEMQATLRLLLAAIGRLPVRIITGELTDAVLAADAVLKALPPTHPPAAQS